MSYSRSVFVDSQHLELALLSIRALSAQPLEPSYTARQQFVFPIDGLHLVSDGKADLMVDLNQMAVIPADHVTRDRHPSVGDMSCLIISPDPSLLEEVWTAYPSFWDRACFGLGIGAQVQMASRRLAWASQFAVPNPLALEEHSIQLVRSAAPEQWDQSAPLGGRRLALIRRTKERLAADLGQQTLAEIASDVGVSGAYLTTLFRQVEGMPLCQYHLRLRLAEALNRLADADDLTVLALDLGFSSHSHFSSAFRARFGVAPSEYRRSQRPTMIAVSNRPPVLTATSPPSRKAPDSAMTRVWRPSAPRSLRL